MITDCVVIVHHFFTVVAAIVMTCICDLAGVVVIPELYSIMNHFFKFFVLLVIEVILTHGTVLENTENVKKKIKITQ